MNSVIVNLESEDLFNSYQIGDELDEDGMTVYSVWISTGPISGYFLKDSDKKKCYFNTIVEAMKALVELIEEEEPQVA
jgi:hypothetical protein